MYPAGRCWVFSANLSAQKLGEPLLTGRLFTAAGSSSIRNWVLCVLILCCHRPCYPPGTTARADRRANSWCGTPCQIMTLRPEMLFWSPWSQEWWLTVVAFSWNFLTKTSRLTREILSDVCVNDWALWGVQRPSPFASILDNPEGLSQPCSPYGITETSRQLYCCPASPLPSPDSISTPWTCSPIPLPREHILQMDVRVLSKELDPRQRSSKCKFSANAITPW